MACIVYIGWRIGQKNRHTEARYVLSAVMCSNCGDLLVKLDGRYIKLNPDIPHPGEIILISDHCDKKSAESGYLDGESVKIPVKE